MMMPWLFIVLSIAFTVSFNLISRISLSTTKPEYAYTILWQVFCGLLALLFLPFDRFSILQKESCLRSCVVSLQERRWG